MDSEYTAMFNGLSRKSQLALKATATFDSLTDFIRDDTKLHPGRFPFYALFMSAVIIPVPAFGVPAAIAGAALLCARYELGDTGKRLNSHLADIFHEADLAERYNAYITPSNNPTAPYTVRPWALARHSARYGWKNARAAGRHAYEAARDYFSD